MLISVNLNELSPTIIIYMLLLGIQIICVNYSSIIIPKIIVQSLEHFSKIFLIVFYLIEKILSKKDNEEKKDI